MSTVRLSATQQQVVDFDEGALAVIAGPGSGKTRVLTERIRRLLTQVPGHFRVLALTFTNKAAKEMTDRLSDLAEARKRAFIGTLHGFCLDVLADRGKHIGLTTMPQIFEQYQDRKQILAQAVSEDAVLYGEISHLSTKERAQRLDDWLRSIGHIKAHPITTAISGIGDPIIERVYEGYNAGLQACGACDFDDLLLHTAQMLTENPELRASLDEHYRYVLVDEYQDTNQAQYQIVAALSQDYPNLCVTGDPDQSIYGWRGARIENILRFERDYPQAKVIRLEENFRSTKAILRSADRLIGHNRQRKAKSLITENAEGEPVELLYFRNELHEADGLARHMRQLVEEQGRDWSDCAIFMRVNALSRQIELALARHRIPAQVAAGAAFFDRAEVKDMLAYLRLIYNPADRAAFTRVVNTPARGLGDTSQRRLLRWADETGITPLEAAKRSREVPQLSKRAGTAFYLFAEMMEDLSFTSAGSVETLLLKVLERTGYTRPWEGSPSEKDQERLANVQELILAARQFDEALGAETTLEGFLEQTALVNETDSLDESRGKVTLMTLHAAKGLEFPIVYVVGLEQGLIPHERATREGDRRELEEERRLLFVGMTRARERLFLTQTVQRSFRGRTLHTIPSHFLTELEQTSRVMDEPESAAPAWHVPVPSQEDAARRRREAPLEFDSKPMLTTAADLLRGSSQAAALPRGFALGSQVRHPRYGLGTVVDVGGFGQRRTVTVSFRDGGDERIEKFVAAQSPLQPVGGV